MGLAGPAIGTLLESGGNREHDPLYIFAHIGVGEPKRGETLPCQPGVALAILFGVVRVANEFDDQSLRRTEKVTDVGEDHMLPTKFARELSVGAVPPHPHFPFRRVAAEFAGSFEKFSLRQQSDCPTPTPPLKGRA